MNMNSPEGTITFDFDCKNLFNKEIPHLIVYEKVTNGHIFRVERNDTHNLLYSYASAGTETRVATINLSEIEEFEKAYFALTWSPTEIRMHFIDRQNESNAYCANGVNSEKKLKNIGAQIVEIGDENMEVMDFRIISDGKLIVEPSAIESWKSTMKGVEILLKGTSEDGYLFEVVQANTVISTIVTGFEIYTKKRCVELEKEGIAPDTVALENKLFSAYEKSVGEPEEVKRKATVEGITYFEKLVKNHINFQSYEECKRAYSKAYKILFGEIGLTSNQLLDIQKIIKHRHRIIHVSPLENIINKDALQAQSSVFINKEFAKNAVSLFENFIKTLHEKTLELRH